MNLQATIYSQLSKHCRIRVVFLNDAGFFAGAGVALRRQVKSFLRHGHEVAVVCYKSYGVDLPPIVTCCDILLNWLGIHTLYNAHKSILDSDEKISLLVIERVMKLNPDLVIVGNLHGASWPLEILPGLQKKGVKVIAYLHDCHWLTGHCAYFGNCDKYLTGCDETCPIPADYPPQSLEKIAPSWQLRRKIFTGEMAIPCAANSYWMFDRAKNAFNNNGVVDVVHLGLDHHLFKPLRKRHSRDLLNIPQESICVLTGSFNVEEQRKGGALLSTLVGRLSEEDKVIVMSFGKGSDKNQKHLGFGLVQDENLMPHVFNAADIYLNISYEESFGQTMMEASACGVPFVALGVGGVFDIARHLENSILVDKPDEEMLFQAVMSLIADESERKRMGQNGRTIIEQEFTLESQYSEWVNYFRKNNI